MGGTSSAALSEARNLLSAFHKVNLTQMHSSTPVEDRRQRSRDTGNSNNPLLVNAQYDRIFSRKPNWVLLLVLIPARRLADCCANAFIRRNKNTRFFLIAALVIIALHTTMYGMRSTRTRSFLLNHHSSPSPLNDDFFSLTAKELFHIFPPPKLPDTVRIYNAKAHQQLKDKYEQTTKKEKNEIDTKIKVLANGGSTTSGAYCSFPYRYYTKFNDFTTEVYNSSVKFTGMGHGARNSLHTALFSANFLPPEIDLIFWEFAINDYGYNPLLGEHLAEKERSMFLAWLLEVERLRPLNPPKVILVYLWKKPFELNQKERINNPIFDAHEGLAEQFDFVVGHVNLASYMDELGQKDSNGKDGMTFADRKRIFLADTHHPSCKGHFAASILLLHLLEGEGEWNQEEGLMKDVVTTAMTDNSSHVTKEKYKWFCGNDTEEKRYVQSRIVGDDPEGWRSPLGSATLELPRLGTIPGSRQLEIHFGSSDKAKLLGKQDPTRNDRISAIPVTCCSGSTRANYTSIRTVEESQPMQTVQAIFLAFRAGFSNMTDLKVFIGRDRKERAKGRLLKIPVEWPCFWKSGLYDSHWFAFSERQINVSRVDLCVDSEQCDQFRRQNRTMLIATAAYS